MENLIKEKTVNSLQQIHEGSQLKIPTWMMISILIVVYLVIKKVIYITDHKRKE